MAFSTLTQELQELEQAELLRGQQQVFTEEAAAPSARAAAASAGTLSAAAASSSSALGAPPSLDDPAAPAPLFPPARVRQFRAFASRLGADVYPVLVRSFAPSVWELDDVKRGLLCLPSRPLAVPPAVPSGQACARLVGAAAAPAARSSSSGRP